VLLIFSVVELVIGLAMLLAPRKVRDYVMPDYQRYEGRVFSATTPGTYRFVGVGFVLMAFITGYAFLRSLS
jgi:hypothetical protein